MDARTIQKEVLLGEPVSFLLKTGQTLQGILVELTRDCVTIENEGRRSVILLELIGALQTAHNSNDNEAEAKNPVSDNARSDILLSHGASEFSFHQAFPARAEDETADKNIDDAKIPVETVAIVANQGNGNGDRALNNQTRPLEAAVVPLLATQAKYEAQIRFARFEPEAVDFQFPTQEIDDNRLNDARTAWQNIKSIYDYAVKVQEMDPKHGRIGRFAYQLERLSEQYSEVQSLKRQAAHAAYLSGQIKNSLELWKKVAFDSDEPNDWKNVAAVARALDDPAVCCYAGGKYYSKAVITEEEGSWFIFINLVHKFWNYSILPSIIRSKQSVSSEEQETLFEAGIYLLKIANRLDLAEEFVTRRLAAGVSCEFLLELFEHLPAEPTDGYQQVVTELEALRLRDLASQRPASPAVRDVSNRQHNGVIRVYKGDKNYGFINAKEDGRDYFFHLSSVSDSNVVQLLGDNPQNQITVRFLAAKGDRGLYAYDVEIPRSNDEMAAQAAKYADATDYQKAAFEMRKLLSFEPDYPNGQELYAKWNRFAAEKKVRGGTLPKGLGYYSRAKCADIVEHDRERAVQLFRLAIQHGDRTESAVKDLATMLGQMGNDHEAIKILNDYRDQARDPRTIDGILMTLYQKTGEADKAIPLLYERVKTASSSTKRAQILGNIANLHMSQQQFDRAEEVLRRVLTAQPDNTVTKRHLAICLLKRQHLDEAERILNEILEQTADVQAIEVLAAVQQARTGTIPLDIDILISGALSDFFTQISAFAKFFLDQVDYKGVPSERIQAQKFHRSDVERLEESATVLGSRLPRDRGSYYLSAAKIDSMLEDSDPNRFYRYLCRSFFSMGDAIVQETGMLDSACDLYCESLAVYDNDHTRSSGEQDAVNALIRVLYATLGSDRIPSMIGPKHLSIDEALEIVMGQHPDRNRVYRYIAYLIYRSRFAAGRVLTRLFRPSWRASALDYLRSQSVEMPEHVKHADDFARLWNALRQRQFEEYRFVSTEFRFLTQIEIVSSSLEDSISRLPSISELLFFDLDKRRLRDFQTILECALELCRQSAFEERERFCLQAESRCRELVREIETSPTKFSIEHLLSVVQSLQQKLGLWIEDFYQRSTPSLTLRLPFDSYSPDDMRQIEVQVAIENESGRSPAESIELIVVPESEQFFSTPKADLRVVGSLRGGEQAIIYITLQLTAQALNAEAFSMNVYAQYRTRSDRGPLVVDQSFSIQLTSEFEDFPNPYHVYANGGVVTDSSMFYGRGDMIKGIVHTLATNPSSKSIVLYGQRRSGKSSILYHLNEALSRNPDVLVVDIENIGSFLDPHSTTPLLYQILWALLKELQRSIRARVEVNSRPLDFSFPTEQEFFSHHAPLVYFNTIFEDFEDCAGRTEGWQNVRVVLLVDEFSYIYGYIIRGTLSQDFMVNWKALLQRNHFSAVLAGQDVMPKFIDRFGNEWGTTQPIQIGYLNQDDARALIDEPIKIGGKDGESRYRERAIERIIELTAGNPFYVQIICNKLVEHMRTKRQKLATKADVERIRDGLIRSVDALKLSDFENLISSGDKSPDAVSSEDALAVLRAVARNTQQVSTCARGEITAETEKPVNVILEDLVHRNVLECERGSFYRIRVGLFKEWLIANSDSYDGSAGHR